MVPPYVQASLTSLERINLHTKSIGATQIATTSGPVRILCENGSEIRVSPLEIGLGIEILTHVHPWLINRNIDTHEKIKIGSPVYDPTFETHTTRITQRIVLWSKIDRLNMSGHERLSLIKKRKDATISSKTTFIDASLANDILIGDAGGRIRVKRPCRSDLAVYIEHLSIEAEKSQTDPEKMPYMLGHRFGINIERDLIHHAKTVNATFRALPTLERWALDFAIFFKPLIFLIEAGFKSLLIGVKNTISKGRKRASKQ
jgi:hypothetical protein